MFAQPRVGLLPLYLALYDEVSPENRPERESFAQRVADRLTEAGLTVELAEVCCVRAEVERAVAELDARGVDLLATLHLAYSPSLESVEVLAASELPLMLLDTTPAANFDDTATGADMSANHGIHGVQDLACMLRRRGRTYSLAVGHVDDEAFLREAVAAARAAVAARRLRSMRVLVFGDEFVGMGDFAVEPEVLARGLGVSVQRVPVAEIAARMEAVSEQEVAEEDARDCERFDCSRAPAEVLRRSNHVGLALRGLLDEAGAGAFSFNFQSFTTASGVPTVPFLEASKAMARGVGYAGEADALTAAFVGALLQGFGEVTFTEMFCPDWMGNAVFMSHMGECNVALAATPPRLVEKDYAFGDVANPAVAVFAPRPGPATLVNLAPGPGDAFDVIASRLRVLDYGLAPGFPEVPHFWVRPEDSDLREFLRGYSECGGTHHSALVMGDQMDALGRMAQMLGLNSERL